MGAAHGVVPAGLQQFHLAFLGPQTHRGLRHHEDEQQRQIHEERLHGRLPRLEEPLLAERQVARKEQEDKLHAKINDLKTLEREYSRVLKELNNELLQQLEKKIKEVIGDLAKKEKYTLVLIKQPAVAYSVPGLDITNTVISMLDSRSKKPEADK